MRLFASRALLPEGWARDVAIEIDADGRIAAVSAGAKGSGAETARGPVVPGMPNLHSHAFQRAMAGLTQRGGPSGDSFWTWRELMYRFVARITPEDCQAIAAALYVEMLEAGYTSVAEFHYLHHGPGGMPYADVAEMSRRVIAAAEAAGIGLTLLPVFYSHGGFGAKPLSERQQRFRFAPDGFLNLVDTLLRVVGQGTLRRIGIAPHSLRAVTEEELRVLIEGIDHLDAGMPVHIHIAEQTGEVEDCLTWSGERPVAWLMKRLEIGPRWTLVHATHLDSAEIEGLAGSGAAAGICPTTEADLGDGLFPAEAYLAAGGVFGIGSDSHVAVDPFSELRLFEYGQRLTRRRRNVLAEGEGQSVGDGLWRRAASTGARALNQESGAIAAGRLADLVVLDPSRVDEAPLDQAIFGPGAPPVADVMVGGRWVVRDGRHPRRDQIRVRYREALSRLRD